MQTIGNTSRNAPPYGGGAFRDDTKNGCVVDYTSAAYFFIFPLLFLLYPSTSKIHATSPRTCPRHDSLGYIHSNLCSLPTGRRGVICGLLLNLRLIPHIAVVSVYCNIEQTVIRSLLIINLVNKCIIQCCGKLPKVMTANFVPRSESFAFQMRRPSDDIRSHRVLVVFYHLCNTIALRFDRSSSYSILQ